MARQFGTHGGRPALGGASDRPSARANTQRDYSPDLEHGALWFALLGLTLPFIVTGTAIIIWISFFE